MDKEEIPYEDFYPGRWKITQYWGDFLDGIEGHVYHYKHVSLTEKCEIESDHPWDKSDIVCCERCKTLFDL